MTKYQDKALTRPRTNVLITPVVVNPKKAMSAPNMDSRTTIMRTERGRVAFSRLTDGRDVDILFLGNRAVYTMKRKAVGMMENKNARIVQFAKVRTPKEAARMAPQPVLTKGENKPTGLEADPR